MLKNKLMLALILLFFAPLLIASPYYMFMGLGYSLPDTMNPQNQTSATGTISGTGGFGNTGFYEQYHFNSDRASIFTVGGGYFFAPLFAPTWVAKNAVEVSIGHTNLNYSGQRDEWVSNDYPSIAPAVSTIIPLTINLRRINLLADYVVFFKPFNPGWSLFVNGGAGVSSYKYNTLSNSDNTAIVGSETFNKTGINIVTDLGFGVNYQLEKRYTVSAGYKLLMYLLSEKVPASWGAGANQSSVTPTVLAPGQNSVAVQGSRLNSQLYLRFAYQF